MWSASAVVAAVISVAWFLGSLSRTFGHPVQTHPLLRFDRLELATRWGLFAQPLGHAWQLCYRLVYPDGHVSPWCLIQSDVRSTGAIIWNPHRRSRFALNRLQAWLSAAAAGKGPEARQSLPTYQRLLGVVRASAPRHACDGSSGLQFGVMAWHIGATAPDVEHPRFLSEVEPLTPDDRVDRSPRTL